MAKLLEINRKHRRTSLRMTATGATLDTVDGLNLNPVGTYTLKDASSLLDALTLINMSSELAPL